MFSLNKYNEIKYFNVNQFKQVQIQIILLIIIIGILNFLIVYENIFL